MDKIICIMKFDISSIKKSYLSMTIWFFVFGLFYAIFARDLTLIPASIMIWATFLVGLPFLNRDLFGLDNLLATFPVNRKHIIRGRYVYSIISGFLYLAMAEVMICIAAAFFNSLFDMKQVTFALYCGFFAYCFIISIQLPMYFRYSSARIIQIAPLFLFIIFVLQYQLSGIYGIQYEFLEVVKASVWENPVLSIALTLFTSALLLEGSYILSCKGYINKNL